MRGADAWAGSIKSGGGTRRAAKMVVLDVDHPDIREFIWCKAKEEDKAAALRDAGFDMSIDGDGFHSIQYQNANNSVRVTDEFMQAVENDEDWHLIARTTGEPIGEPIPARELMAEIAEAAWRCADPGVQYDTVDQPVAHVPELGADQRVEPVLPADARSHDARDCMPIEELVERGEAGEEIRVYTIGPRPRAWLGRASATRRSRSCAMASSRSCACASRTARELRCTPNHRIWTLNRGYVRAEELTEQGSACC